MAELIREIWQRRDLIRQLVIKDLKVRYRRPALGFFWAFFSPFLTAIIFYAVFAVILKVEIKEAPFILYLMTAIFPWKFFSDGLLAATTSLVDNKNLIKESAFPRYLIPVATILSHAAVFLPSLAVVILFSGIILKGVPVQIILLPLLLLVQLFLVVGLSLFLSLVYVRWRDIRYLLEVALLVLFYLTPVFYSIELVKTVVSPVIFKAYLYNPLVGILFWYRLCFLKGFYSWTATYLSVAQLILIPAAAAVLLLALGIYYFRKVQASINDCLYY